jgi:carbon-monoxide dehydrogenase medium subunit
MTTAVLADASAALALEIDPHEDQQASAAMRRHLAKVLMIRCTGTLLGRSDLGNGGPA